MLIASGKMAASWGTGVSLAVLANGSITNETTLPIGMVVAIAAGTLGIGLWIARSMNSIDTRLTVIEGKLSTAAKDSERLGKEIEKLPCRTTTFIKCNHPENQAN
jgi:hypothetical protein